MKKNILPSIKVIVSTFILFCHLYSFSNPSSCFVSNGDVCSNTYPSTISYFRVNEFEDSDGSIQLDPVQDPSVQFSFSINIENVWLGSQVTVYLMKGDNFFAGAPVGSSSEIDRIDLNANLNGGYSYIFNISTSDLSSGQYYLKVFYPLSNEEDKTDWTGK